MPDTTTQPPDQPAGSSAAPVDEEDEPVIEGDGMVPEDRQVTDTNGPVAGGSTSDRPPIDE